MACSRMSASFILLLERWAREAGKSFFYPTLPRELLVTSCCERYPVQQ